MLRSVLIGILLVIILLAVQYMALKCDSPTVMEPMPPPQAISLIISSNTTSHFTPCGCSTPTGGMLRRGTAFNNIREQAEWPVLFIDSGNVTMGYVSDVNVKKDDYIFQGYQILDYDMVNVGFNDTKLGYEILNNYRDLYNIPWASGSIYHSGVMPALPVNEIDSGDDTNPDILPTEDQAGEISETAFPPYIIHDIDGFLIACLGILIQDPAILNTNQNFSFGEYKEAIQKNVLHLREEMGVGLIIAVLDMQELPEGFDVASVFEGVDIVIGGREQLTPSPNANLNPGNPLYRPGDTASAIDPDSDADTVTEPPEIEYLPISSPLLVPLATTQGKRLNRIDIWLDDEGRPFDYQFRSINLDPSYEDDPRMAQVAEGYDADVLIDELISQVSRSFSGSEACSECHPGFNEAWADHGHFHAYQTIMDQASYDDRSCTECHAAGFINKPRLLLYENIPENIRNIGCEGCHQNGQSHINYIESINMLTPEQLAEHPLTDQMAQLVQPSLCLKCHKGEFGEGFDATLSIEESRTICQSVR